MIQNYQPNAAELRMLRAEAANVRKQNAERKQVVDLPQPVQAERIAS